MSKKEIEMQIETNRKKYLTPGTIYLLRPKNCIFISSANKLNHELSKTIGGYALRKIGDIPQFSLKLINLLKQIEEEFNKLIKEFSKSSEDFITEAAFGKDRQIDIVRLRDQLHYEFENDPTIKKEGAFTFYI